MLRVYLRLGRGRGRTLPVMLLDHWPVPDRAPLNEAWSEAARKAAIEARRRRSKKFLGDLPKSAQRDAGHQMHALVQHLKTDDPTDHFADDTVSVKRGIVTHAASMLGDPEHSRLLGKLRTYAEIHEKKAEDDPGLRKEHQWQAKRYRDLHDHLVKKS